jgi:signal transduction histidine kinase
MPTRFELTTQPVRAGRLLLFALVTTFVAEYVIMKLLPHILPAECGETCAAVADSCLLTLIVAPVLWMIAVLPIQRLGQSRTYFLRRALTSQEEERQRITQDLHDGIGQSLTSLLLGLRAMEETTADANVRQHAESLRKMGAGIHEDLRRIVRGLRPAILDQLGLVAAIEQLVDEVRNAGISTVEFSAAGLKGLRLSADLESTAFRIVQEAISNSVRHSSATHLEISMNVVKDALALRVADNGQGFEGSTILNGGNGSYGLLGIRERAMIAGGRAEIQTSPGAGTIVSAHLPLVLRSEDHE